MCFQCCFQLKELIHTQLYFNVISTLVQFKYNAIKTSFYILFGGMYFPTSDGSPDVKDESVACERAGSILPLTRSESRSSGLGFPFCKLGAKTLAYCAYFSKIVTGLKREAVEADRQADSYCLVASCGPRGAPGPRGRHSNARRASSSRGWFSSSPSRRAGRQADSSLFRQETI